MSKIFGGKSAKSGNKAYKDISGAFSPMFGLAQSGGNALQALLSGDTSGFQSYKDAIGFDPMVERGSRGITGNAASRGLLRSGSTGEALMKYGNEMENLFANNYMDKLMGQAGLGIQAGGLVAKAGEFSKSKEKPGIAKFLGTAASGAAASDRRLKKNIQKIRTLDNGLTLYRYEYIHNDKPQIGVMADEVERFAPEALGPVVDGYKTVDYSKLMEVMA